METIDILIIDDDKEYCRTLKNRFRLSGNQQNKNILLTDYQNLEEGFAELENNPKYKALILDAKSRIKADQEKDDYDFLPVALSELEKLNVKTGRLHIPFAINTGYYKDQERFNRLLSKMQGRLFDKSLDEEKLLSYLLEGIDKVKYTIVEQKFSQIFEMFNLGYLDEINRADLLNILLKLNDESDVKNSFNPLRKILEAFYAKIKEEFPESIPDDILWRSPGQINLTYTWRYLSGLDVHGRSNDAIFPKHIVESVDHVQNMSQKISHEYRGNVSLYSYQAATFSLLESLLWLKNYIKENK